MKHHTIRNCLITVASLIGAFLLSLLFQHIFNVQEHIPTVFIFGVFLTSLLTEGYLYGVAAAFISTFAVNYAFAFPYYAVDFTTPVNLISGAIMMAVAILTGALTTKLKRQETSKAESDKERMRANLLRAVSHDLRTPLTTIYGSSTTLLENSNGMTDDQKADILTGIKEDAEWLIRMVENLLSITRLDGDQVTIVKVPTVLDELIDSVMLKFRKRYPTQPVTLELPDDLVIVPMDAILIEQVLVNILENAVQHAKGMTRLTLRVFTLGKNVRSVGKGVFKGCKKLKFITVKTSKLNKKSLKNLLSGSNVKTIRLKGISKHQKAKVAAKYSKWLPAGVSLK